MSHLGVRKHVPKALLIQPTFPDLGQMCPKLLCHDIWIKLKRSKLHKIGQTTIPSQRLAIPPNCCAASKLDEFVGLGTQDQNQPTSVPAMSGRGYRAASDDEGKEAQVSNTLQSKSVESPFFLPWDKGERYCINQGVLGNSLAMLALRLWW